MVIKIAERLTAKQEKFVRELIKGKSQREAYKSAYSAKNMSNATIDSNACRLLKDNKVAARYDELISKVRSKAEQQAIMTAVEILQEIESIAKDDISNYLEFRTEKTVVGHDEDGPVFAYRPIVSLKDSREISTKNIAEISLGANGTFKFKLYSREAALAKLAELLGVDTLKAARQKLAEERFAHDLDIDAKRYW